MTFRRSGKMIASGTKPRALGPGTVRPELTTTRRRQLIVIEQEGLRMAVCGRDLVTGGRSLPAKLTSGRAARPKKTIFIRQPSIGTQAVSAEFVPGYSYNACSSAHFLPWVVSEGAERASLHLLVLVCVNTR
jgi:hypothetical protein